MARLEKILKENREFYCESYYKKTSLSMNLLAYGYVVLIGILTCRMKEILLRVFYFRGAAQIGTNGQEVMDYVEVRTGKWWMDSYAVIIILMNLLLLICIWMFRKGFKNYDTYKNRWLIFSVPAIFVLAEFMMILFLMGRELGREGIVLSKLGEWYEFAGLGILELGQLFLSRLLMTLELRQTENSILLKLLELFADKALEKF